MAQAVISRWLLHSSWMSDKEIKARKGKVSILFRWLCKRNTCQVGGMCYHCRKLGRTNLWDLLPIVLEQLMRQLLHTLACAIVGITRSIQPRNNQTSETLKQAKRSLVFSHIGDGLTIDSRGFSFIACEPFIIESWNRIRPQVRDKSSVSWNNSIRIGYRLKYIPVQIFICSIFRTMLFGKNGPCWIGQGSVRISRPSALREFSADERSPHIWPIHCERTHQIPDHSQVYG